MKDDLGILGTLALHFAFLSLFAVGGAVAAVPEFQRLSVDVMGWMNDREFAEMFAIAQLSPGPNALLVTLIGYHVAGVSGAVVATVAMCGPTCLFAYFVGRVWDRFKEARWRMIVQAALVPVSMGLLAASALLITQATARSWVAVALTAVTALVGFYTRLNPLWLFAAGGVLGLFGLI